mmetsp:Transcript_30056/g.92974  ORF Transcript_30056/g.92974 Transcript_30056/m.92974 type:complete len:113 (-) Transcript_30056:194-532(-)
MWTESSPSTLACATTAQTTQNLQTTPLTNWQNWPKAADISAQLPAPSEHATDVGYQCSCAYFWKKGKCCHSMGLAMKLGILKVPPQFVNDHVGDKRKPGRKRRHKKKLKKKD